MAESSWRNSSVEGDEGEVSELDYLDEPEFNFKFRRKEKRAKPGSRTNRYRRAGVDEDEIVDSRGFEDVETDVVFGQFLNEFVNWSSQQISLWQDMLIAAGLLDEKEAVRGYADESTISALYRAAKEASLRKKTLVETLEERASKFKKDEGEDKAKLFREQLEDAYKRDLAAAYTRIWGTLPPPGYVEGAQAAGVNIYEFEYAEKQKPAYVNSPDYQMNRIGTEARLADRFGALG